MKILFLVNMTGPNGYYHKMSRVRFHGMESIGEVSDTSFWGPGWEGYDNSVSVSDNLAKMDSTPDLIVTYKPLDMIGMKDVKIPVCLRYNEMYDFNWTTEEIDKSGANFVICHHENDMAPYIKHYGDKVKFVHIPHCGKKEVFKDWGEEKIYDFMIGGAVNVNTQVTGQHYPLRDRMVGILRRLGDMGYKVYQHPHPGYTHDDAHTNKYLMDFSKAINRAKICITCSGAPKSRFGKYIEIPMSGTAIAGDIPGQDEDDFRKFVIELTMEMSDDEIINKLVGYIKDEEALKRVTDRGLTWSKGYTQEYYASRFIEEASKYLDNSVRFDDLANTIGYDYTKDLDDIKTIAYYTKTRSNPSLECELAEYLQTDPQGGCGLEQTFFIKSILENVKAKKFFEIGTGRGTACYAACLIPSIEEIVTYDTIPHNQQKNDAIGYKASVVSNDDLYGMINFQEKKKINFKLRTDSNTFDERHFDVCFIDGNHSDYPIVRNDFEICRKVMKDDGIIIWDDYTDRFIVKKVVDDIVAEYPEYKILKVQTRNTIFDNGSTVDDWIVMMSKTGFDEWV